MIINKTTFKHGAIISLLHLVFTLSMLHFSFVIGLAYLDTFEQQNSFKKIILTIPSFMASILTSPGVFIPSPSPLGVWSIVVYCAIWLSNSVLWGFGLLFIWHLIKQRKAKR